MFLPTIHQVKQSPGFDKNWYCRFRSTKHHEKTVLRIEFPTIRSLASFVTYWAKTLQMEIPVYREVLFVVFIPIQVPSY